MYQYQDMSNGEFENLVVEICKEILGIATQGFATGPDGGRDGKFIGTANQYPSLSSPWTGTTIIQAKHTLGINAHYLEKNFFNPTSDTAVLSAEVRKIKKLKTSDNLCNYMLFSNRKLTGGAEQQIRQYISEQTGLSVGNIAILGVDDLNKYLSRFKHIPNIVNLIPLTKFPSITPDELAEIIPAFAEVFDKNIKRKGFEPVERTSYEEKNKLNNMRDDFSKVLIKNYLSHVTQVQNFLNDPQNEKLQELYQEAVEEFQETFIIPRQRELEYFDDVYNQLVELLLARDYILNKNKKITRVLVFYMYYNCDIGRSN